MIQLNPNLKILKAILGIKDVLMENLKDESKKQELEMLLFDESAHFVREISHLLDSILVRETK